ncbi:hypothetical protein ACWGE0_21665 [Lentzea sp. NPDC054927]
MTNGLGRLVALDLARRGLDLGIVARSAAEVDELRASVEQIAPGTTVDAFVADLSSLHDVRRGELPRAQGAHERLARQADRPRRHGRVRSVT